MGSLRIEKQRFWLSEGIRPPRKLIMQSPRIGIDYAGPKWSTKPYRFTLDLTEP